MVVLIDRQLLFGGIFHIYVENNFIIIILLLWLSMLTREVVAVRERGHKETVILAGIVGRLLYLLLLL